MSREIRHVPAHWAHPKRVNPHSGIIEYQPLLTGSYDVAVREWRKDLRGWHNGYKSWRRGRVYTFLDMRPGSKSFKKGWVSVAKVQKTILEGIYAERKKHAFGDGYESADERKIKSGTYLFSDYAGQPPTPPNPEDYMPDGPWYQLFETVSQGTPLSPPFATPEELLAWLSTHKDYWGDRRTPEQADRLLKDEWLPTAVFIDGQWVGVPEVLTA